MPNVPNFKASFQLRKAYMIISEFKNFFNEEMYMKRGNCAFFKNVLITYEIFLGKLFAFFFFKTRVLRIEITKTLKNWISSFFVSDSGSKILIFMKEKKIKLMKIVFKNQNLVYSNPYRINFERWLNFSFDSSKISMKNLFCFSPGEKFLVMSSLKQEMVIFDLEDLKISSIKIGHAVQKIWFPSFVDFPFKLFGKAKGGTFFEYRLKSKVVSNLNGTENSNFKENFFIFSHKTEVSFLCECHRKTITQIFLGFKLENFYLLTQNKILSSKGNNVLTIHIGSGKVRNLNLHYYRFFGLKTIFNDFPNFKFFRKNLLNFYSIFFLEKKNFFFIKPLSEKHFFFVHFKSSLCYNKKTNDVKFFGKSPSVALASDSNSIKYFSGHFFQFLGQMNFGTSAFLNIQIRGQTLLALNSMGQLILGSLSSFYLIRWFKLHNTSTGIFFVNKEINKNGYLISGKKNFLKIWALEQPKKKNFKVKLLNIKRFSIGKVCTAAISPSGKVLGFSSNDKKIFIVKYPFRKHFLILKASNKCAWALNFSNKEKYIVAGLEDGSVLLFDVFDCKIIKKFQGDGYPIYTCFFNLDDSQVFHSNSEGKIRIWNIEKGLCTNTILSPGNQIWTCDISLKEEFLITGCEKGTIIMLKDLSSDISEKKRSNFSLFKNLQKSLRQESWSSKKFEKIFNEFSIIRDPRLFLDLIKYFSKKNNSKFWSLLFNFLKKADDLFLKFLFRTMLIWSENFEEISWIQRILDFIFSKKNVFLSQKINNKILKVLLYLNQKWVFKLRDFNSKF